MARAIEGLSLPLVALGAMYHDARINVCRDIVPPLDLVWQDLLTEVLVPRDLPS